MCKNLGFDTQVLLIKILSLEVELLTLLKEKHNNLIICCPSYQLGVFVSLKDKEVQFITFEDGKEANREVVKYN